MGWFSKIFGGSKGAPAPPPGPDPWIAAAERSQASEQQAQTAADYANRGNITDAWGTQTSTPRLVTDPATGKQFTTYDTSYTLNPQQQQALDAQMRIDASKSGLAESMLGRVGEATGQPMDYSQFQAWGDVPMGGQLTGAGKGIMAGLDVGSLGAMPQADANERQRIENMMFQRMAPQHQQAQAALETQLANQGYQRGTPQFNQALQDLQRNQADERFNAMQYGGQEMERLFGMGMDTRRQGWEELMGAGEFQNRAQAQGYEQASGENAQNFNQRMQQAAYQNQLRGAQVGEAMQRRAMPLNELNALLSGAQVEKPDMQAYTPSRSVGGVDYSGAQQSSYNAGRDAAADKAAKKQGMMSGVGGLVSAGIMAF